MKKAQAEKASRQQIELHSMRQKALGEKMINDHDGPRRWELIATFSVILLIFIGTLRGWW